MLDGQFDIASISGHGDSYLGAVHDQDFFAARHHAGHDLQIPFSKKHFNALINIQVAMEEATLRTIAVQLLQHGMRAAICHGNNAEVMGEIIDELVDDGGYVHEGRTVFSSVHNDEDLHDVIDYFVTPNGLADVGLILTIGEELAAGDVETAFSNITSDAMELEVVLA